MRTFISSPHAGLFGPARTFLCLLLLFAATAYAQDPPQYGTPFASVPDAPDVNLYQVHLRPYSAAGNFAGVTARLDAIRALGINVIYLMPHYPHGTDSRSSASPYCIKDFKAVASEYGTLTDLRQLVDGAHARGMAVLLDFVPNQTSWDHPWITQHPDWYERDGSGNIIALFPDVAKLNFSNTAMRAALVDAMRYWIFAANVDGFRYDYANNPPLDFWTNTINNLRGITTHKLLLFAEGDRPENFQTGFDLNFGDKWYYDAIRRISQEGLSAAQIQTTTNTEYAFANSTQQVVRYTANHDTESDVTPISVFQSHAGVVANFVVSAYMRGVPFLTSGQETDFNQTIPWPWNTVKINWNTNPGAATDFTNILNFRTSSTAIRRGTMTNYSTADVCSFTKTSGSEKVVVITNLRNSSRIFTIPAAMAGSYRNPWTNATVTLTSGATQSLNGYQYIVLTSASVTPVPVTAVSVSPTSASVSAGTTRQLTATVAPANATNQNVSWSSSNTAVATVNASGLVTAVAAGTATITVTTQDGNRTATSAITVTPSTSFTVHFYKPTGWGTGIRIYWWDAQPSGVLANGTWPGVLMTDEGSGWYGYTFTNVTSTNLIFNDGTSQTADLNRGSNGWYQNGAWFNSNPGTPGPVYYAIRNRWQNTYLYDAGNNVGYGTTIANNNYKWEKVASDGNFFWLRNLGTGHYMHIENQTGPVQCTTITMSWWSAQWSQESVDATWVRFRNRWQTGSLIHVENQTGSAQYANAENGWFSAQWQLVTTTASAARLRTEEEVIETKTEEGESFGEVYPNPAKDGYLTLLIPTLRENESAAVTMQDISGKVVLERQLQCSENIRHGLPPGLYILRVRTNQLSAVKKVIVE